MIQLYRDAVPQTVLTLSPWMTWDDEFSWQSKVQLTDYARDGTPHFELWARKGGRPITLRPARDDLGLMPRSLLSTLYTWADSPADALTLTLHDAAARAVRWASPFISAVPGLGYSRQEADERWRVTLYFMIPELP